MKRKFTDTDIWRIQREEGTHKEIAERWGCKPSFVTMVKNGQRRKRKHRFAPRPSRRKFTDEQIALIRSSTEKQEWLAKVWGTSQSYISQIRNNRRR